MPKRGRESSDKLMAIEISKFNDLTIDEQNRLGTPVRTTRSIYYFKNDDASNIDDLADMIDSLSLKPKDIIVVPQAVAYNIQNRDDDNQEKTDALIQDLMSQMKINGGKRSRKKSRRRRTQNTRKSRRKITHRRKRR